MAFPAVSGSASGMALSLPGVDASALAALIGSVSVDYKVGQINAMVVPVLDRDMNLAPALAEGVWLNYGSERWQIIAQQRIYGASGLQLQLDVQSGLGAALRAERGPRSTRGVTPGQWITTRAKANGGTAVVQSGAKRRHIVQKRGQSTLSVVEDLTSDMAAAWVEVAGTIYVGTPWWAFEGGPKLPVWGMPLTADLVQGFEARGSSADDSNRATATVTVPNEVARQLRPWHRVEVSKAAPADNGLWLVESVNHDLHRSPGTVALTRPRRSVVNKGSSSTTDGTAGGLDVVGTPVKGSTYSDAKRPANWRGVSVAGILARWQANKTRGLGNGIYNACLFTSQEIAGYTHVGDDPHDLMDNILGSRLIRSKAVVPGAVMLYRNGRVGHATVYLGGGRALSTDYPSAYQWSIGTADDVERAFGTFAGWYAPP